MTIHADTLSAIKAQVQIEEVLGDYLTLKKRGKDYWALCPFHDEKTPSFAVVPSKGFYKCFGCDKGGDAITFLIEYKGMSYLEAIQHLATKYSIPIQTDEDNQDSNRIEEGLYILFTLAKDYYQNQLLHAPQVKKYLADRNITSLIDSFCLGYSPQGGQMWYQFATKKGYELPILEQAGLVIQREGKVYDTFRNRLMFPIHNLIGKIVGFGARRLQEDLSTPKYINSVETSVYQKSMLLYGLYQAKRSIKIQEYAYIVEGYTDVLALHRIDIQNVVASAGTSLTYSQVQQLSRFTKHVTLLFDSDGAGQAATLRAIDLLLPQGFEVQVLTLPLGQDPASYVAKHSKDAFLAYVQEHTRDCITFKVQALSANLPETPVARQKIIQEVVATLMLIPDTIKRTVYMQLASKLLRMPEAILQETIQKKIQSPKQYFPSSHTPFRQPHTIYRQVLQQKSSQHYLSSIADKERDILHLLFSYSNHSLPQGQPLASYLFEQLGDISFTIPIHKTLFEQYKAQWQQNPQLKPTEFIQGQQGETQQVAVQIISKPDKKGNWGGAAQKLQENEDSLSQKCQKSLLYLQLALIRAKLHNARKDLRAATSPLQQKQLLEHHQDLQKKLIKVAQKLGIVILPS